MAGGAVLDPDNRRVLRRNGAVVWLRARVETLAQRVGDGAGRPLLGDDPGAALRRLYAQRRPVYQELAQVVVDVDRLDSGDGGRAGARRAVIGRSSVIRVPVTLGDRSYEVLVGPGARHRLLEVLPTGVARAAVVTQAGVDVAVDPGVEWKHLPDRSRVSGPRASPRSRSCAGASPGGA